MSLCPPFDVYLILAVSFILNVVPIPFVRLMHSHKLPLLMFNDAVSFSSTTFLTYGCRVHVIHKLYAIVHVNANGWLFSMCFFSLSFLFRHIHALSRSFYTYYVHIFNFQLSFLPFHKINKPLPIAYT